MLILINMSFVQESDLARASKVAASCFTPDVLQKVASAEELLPIEEGLFLGYANTFFDQLYKTDFELYTLLYNLAAVSLARRDIRSYVDFLEKLKHEEFFIDNVEIELLRGILSSQGLKLWE